MKKILNLVAALVLAAAAPAAFAEMNLAVNVAAPHGNFVCDDVGENMSEVLWGLTAMKITDSNIALRWYIAGGTARSDAQSDGGAFTFTFGVGKAFVHTEHIVSAMTGMIGLDYIFLDSDTAYTVGNAVGKQEISDDIFGFRMGADWTTILKFNRWIGLYTNLGFYYTVGSKSRDVDFEVKDEEGKKIRIDNDPFEFDKTFSGFSFVPSVGINISLGS
ncbi:MAG: hypothetical protein J6K96_03485 [Treponema sp.]|nr:hypothetical protein [Treponema sp.]